MKQVPLDVKQQQNDAGIRNINGDHKVLFNYIEKLKAIVDQPENHQYAITILESFIAYFLEHVIKEEQILKQHLPAKVVEDHTLLHKKELYYLDESLLTLKAKLSAHNIHAIAIELNQEFKNHILRYDNDILQKLRDLKR